MKHFIIIFLAIVLFSGNHIKAQRNKDKNNVDITLGIVPSIASIPRVENGLKNLMLGGKMGMLYYNRKDELYLPAWSIGLYATFLTPQSEPNEVSFHNKAVSHAKMSIWDAGIYCELIPIKIGAADLFQEKTPQFYVSTPISWGLLSAVRIYEYNPDTEDKTLIEKSNFMKIEPGINLNLSLSKYAIISCGVSYQWTFLWNKPLENIQEWPDLGIFKINLTVGARISIFQN